MRNVQSCNKHLIYYFPLPMFNCHQAMYVDNWVYTLHFLHRNYSFRVFMFGDIEILTKLYGLSGSSDKDKTGFKSLGWRIVMLVVYICVYTPSKQQPLNHHFLLPSLFLLNHKATLLPEVPCDSSRSKNTTARPCKSTSEKNATIASNWSAKIYRGWRKCSEGQALQQCENHRP